MNVQVKSVGGEVWERPESRSFCLRGAGVRHPPDVDVSASPHVPGSPRYGGFRGASPRGHHRPLTPFSALSLPTPRAWGAGLKIPCIIAACSFSDQPSPRGPPRVSSLQQKTLLSPRKLQGFQELWARNWGPLHRFSVTSHVQ